MTPSPDKKERRAATGEAARRQRRRYTTRGCPCPGNDSTDFLENLKRRTSSPIPWMSSGLVEGPLHSPLTGAVSRLVAGAACPRRSRYVCMEAWKVTQQSTPAQDATQLEKTLFEVKRVIVGQDRMI